MADAKVDANDYQSIQGFIPVNAARDAPQASIPAHPNGTAALTKDTKKRKRKQKDDSLPSPPKTIKAAKKTKENSGKASTSRNDKTARGHSPRAPKPDGHGALCETTKSKLNVFHHNTLMTPCSGDEETMFEGNIENLPPIGAQRMSDTHIGKYCNTNTSDSLLSSELWKNQEHSPNYPCLYGIYTKKVSEPAVLVGDSDVGDIVESHFLDELHQVELQQQHTAEETAIVDDNELERLFDGLNDDGAGFKNLLHEEDQVDQLISPSLPAQDERHGTSEQEDFPMEEGLLESLYEANRLTASPTKPVADFESTVITEMDELDLEEDEFEELLAFAEQLPDLPVNKTQSTQPHTTEYVHSPEMSVSMCQVRDSSQNKQQKGSEIFVGPRARFSRPPHPPPLETPGPIPGLSTAKRILTCFRIGEAINATVKAQKQGYEVFLELYARVIQSIRAGPVQTFRLVDLWSTASNPGIILRGRWVGWEGIELWEKDGRVFSEDHLRDVDYDADGRERPLARKCRVIGSLRKDATGSWMLDIKNLWEAGWDDVAYSKHMFCEPEEDEVA